MSAIGGIGMEVFADFLKGIDDPKSRARTEEVLLWVGKTFPNLVPKIAWNQPMFTDHGTFIIGFSVAKKHLAIAPEGAAVDHFADELRSAGYDLGKKFVRFTWDRPFDYSILKRMIEFNISDKAGYTTFWRKE